MDTPLLSNEKQEKEEKEEEEEPDEEEEEEEEEAEEEEKEEEEGNSYRRRQGHQQRMQEGSGRARPNTYRALSHWPSLTPARTSVTMMQQPQPAPQTPRAQALRTATSAQSSPTTVSEKVEKVINAWLFDSPSASSGPKHFSMSEFRQLTAAVRAILQPTSPSPSPSPPPSSSASTTSPSPSLLPLRVESTSASPSSSASATATVPTMSPAAVVHPPRPSLTPAQTSVMTMQQPQPQPAPQIPPVEELRAASRAPPSPSPVLDRAEKVIKAMLLDSPSASSGRKRTVSEYYQVATAITAALQPTSPSPPPPPPPPSSSAPPSPSLLAPRVESASASSAPVPMQASASGAVPVHATASKLAQVLPHLQVQQQQQVAVAQPQPHPQPHPLLDPSLVHRNRTVADLPLKRAREEPSMMESPAIEDDDAEDEVQVPSVNSGLQNPDELATVTKAGEVDDDDEANRRKRQRLEVAGPQQARSLFLGPGDKGKGGGAAERPQEKAVLVVGNTYLDEFVELPCFPTPDGKFAVREIAEDVGGSATNACCGFLACGVTRARLHSLIGDDDVGLRLLARLHAKGIDLCLCKQIHGGKTGRTIVLLTPNGMSTKLGHGGVADELVHHLMPAEEVVPFDHVHLASVSLGLLEKVLHELHELADRSSSYTAHEALASHPPSHRFPTLSLDLGASILSEDPKKLCNVFKRVDVVCFNEHSIRLVYGIDIVDGDTTSSTSDHLWTHIIQQELAGTMTKYVITLGLHGAHVVSAHEHTFRSSILTHVVDSTGAGDAFASAFVSFTLFWGNADGDALEKAHCAAAMKIQHRGGANGHPTKAAIEAEWRRRKAEGEWS